jgi:peptidoglycan hydrolase-like protein with peptidoglycan-binding domain
MPGPVRLMVFEGYAPGYGFFNHFGALSRPLLRRGSKGAAVVEAQKKLMEILRRNFRAGADGDFGPETETAVREVQAQFGLAVDGIIGNDTWTLLLGEEVNTGATPAPSGPTTPVDTNIPGLRRPPTLTRPVMPTFPVDISIGGSGSGTSSGPSYAMIVGGIAVVGALAYFLTRKKA